MCAPTVSYTQQNYDATTEKLAFKCHKSFNGATANFHQHNPYITSGIISVTIPSCIIYYLFYQEFLTVCAYPLSIAEFLIVSAIP